jgi:hypothetical protein
VILLRKCLRLKKSGISISLLIGEFDIKTLSVVIVTMEREFSNMKIVKN